MFNVILSCNAITMHYIYHIYHTPAQLASVVNKRLNSTKTNNENDAIIFLNADISRHNFSTS